MPLFGTERPAHATISTGSTWYASKHANGPPNGVCHVLETWYHYGLMMGPPVSRARPLTLFKNSTEHYERFDNAMAFLTCPGCAEAVIRITNSGKEVVNVLNFFMSGGYTQSDLNNLAAVVDTAVGTDYLPNIDHLFTYVETHVRGLQNIVDLESISNAHAGVGGDTTGSLPLSATACITLRTGHTGRSARGRFYSIGPTASDIQNAGEWKASYMTALVGFLTDVLAQSALAGWTFSILSRQSGGVPRLAGVTLPITLIEARNQDIDSQRGRLLRGH